MLGLPMVLLWQWLATLGGLPRNQKTTGVSHVGRPGLQPRKIWRLVELLVQSSWVSMLCCYSCLIFYCRIKKNDTPGEVVPGPTFAHMGSATQGPTGTGSASSQNPWGSFAYEQPYGQTPAYPPSTGPFPSNPPPLVGYSPYPVGSAYPPPTKYPDSF